MNRQLIYAGQIPLETDLLSAQKNDMIALAKLAAAVLGTTTQVNGLGCNANSPAALNVVVSPGEIYSLQNIDGTAYSSLAADTTHQIVKQGILLDAITLACAAPVTAGQSVNYLIQATYADSDSDAVVLPYYNASNPSQAYSGPANAGTTNNTVRKGVCTVSAKAGIAAATGSQTTPAPDAGYVGLYVVTVANGQATVTAGNIAQAAGAPIIAETLIQKISQATAAALFVGMTGNQTIAGTKTFSSPPKALNIAKVWARCNGSAATITSSHNVSSLTRTSAGVYVLNYTSAMADSLHSACITAAGVSGVANYMAIGGPVQVGIGMSTSGLQFGTCYITNTSGNATAIDADNISVQIFGN
jgi:hypothetical protein